MSRGGGGRGAVVNILLAGTTAAIARFVPDRLLLVEPEVEVMLLLFPWGITQKERCWIRPRVEVRPLPLKFVDNEKKTDNLGELVPGNHSSRQKVWKTTQ